MIVFQNSAEKKVAVIGAGRLGSNIIAYLSQKKDAKIIATRRNRVFLEMLQTKYPGLIISSDNQAAVESAEMVVLAVKPDCVEDVSREIAQQAKDKLVISAVAAKNLDCLENLMKESRVARVMTGVFVGEEIAAYTLGSRCKEGDAEMVKYAFGETATPIEELFLAERTWIACDTGLIAKGISLKTARLVKQGLDLATAMRWYASALGAVANRLDAGMTGDEIMTLVAGPKSLTGKIDEAFESEGLYKTIDRWIQETIIKCR